jgi:hypothetical protein
VATRPNRQLAASLYALSSIISHSFSLVAASPHRTPAPLFLAAAHHFCRHTTPTPPTEPRWRLPHSGSPLRVASAAMPRPLLLRNLIDAGMVNESDVFGGVGDDNDDFLRALINADLPGRDLDLACGSSWLPWRSPLRRACTARVPRPSSKVTLHSICCKLVF